jgi:hypothetical protein
MTTSHTPGPWRIIDGTEVRGADGTIVCNTADYRVPAPAAEEVAVPDAALIAAAPDLLAALQRIVRAADRMPIDSPLDGIIDEARAAIARATGQA